MEVPSVECDTGLVTTAAAINLTTEGQHEWASNEWEEAQASDPNITIVTGYLERNEAPKGPERQTLSCRVQKLQVKSTVLYGDVQDTAWDGWPWADCT